MMKTFTRKRFAMLFACLLICIFAMAQEVVLDFNNNPMEWPTGKDKLVADKEYTYQNLTFITHHGDGRFANYIDNTGLFKVFGQDSFTFKAPKGKKIKSIVFYLDNGSDFTIATKDNHLYSKEDQSYSFLWDENQESEVTFVCNGKFGSKFNKIIITFAEEEKAIEQKVIYDFNSINPIWSITDVNFDSTDEQEGKIEDSYVLNQDDVALTTQNNHKTQVTRVKDHTLVVPTGNTITFSVPIGKKITKIEITTSSTRSRLKIKDKTGELSLTKKVASYAPDSTSVTLEGVGGKAQIKKVILTIIKDLTPTSIKETVAKKLDNKVYNLNGVQVGTTDNLKALPKGVYIVNGLKVLVR